MVLDRPGRRTYRPHKNIKLQPTNRSAIFRWTLGRYHARFAAFRSKAAAIRAWCMVFRVFKDPIGGTLFHDPAILHDDYPTAERADHFEIVTDKQVGETMGLLGKSCSRSTIRAWTDMSKADVGSSRTMTLA